jgi:hypothetical protein
MLKNCAQNRQARDRSARTDTVDTAEEWVHVRSRRAFSEKCQADTSIVWCLTLTLTKF